ncbi:MAG: FYDLN acid domain-containing protein [Pseudomonadota bacterium]
MAKPKLGTKYTCASCGTKFYDLGRNTPVCPKCAWNPQDSTPARRSTSSSLADDDGGVLKLRAVFEGEGSEDAFEDDAELEAIVETDEEDLDEESSDDFGAGTDEEVAEEV